MSTPKTTKKTPALPPSQPAEPTDANNKTNDADPKGKDAADGQTKTEPTSYSFSQLCIKFARDPIVEIEPCQIDDMSERTHSTMLRPDQLKRWKDVSKHREVCSQTESIADLKLPGSSSLFRSYAGGYAYDPYGFSDDAEAKPILELFCMALKSATGSQALGILNIFHGNRSPVLAVGKSETWYQAQRARIYGQESQDPHYVAIPKILPKFCQFVDNVRSKKWRIICVTNRQSAREFTPDLLKRALKPVAVTKIVKYEQSPSGLKDKELVGVTRVLSQMFHEMTMTGTKFGYISTGHVLIFLKVKRKEPQNLYFRVFEPKSIAESVKDVDIDLFDTRLGQLCSFVLMASKDSQKHPWCAERVRDAISHLSRWDSYLEPSSPADPIWTSTDGNRRSSKRLRFSSVEVEDDGESAEIHRAPEVKMRDCEFCTPKCLNNLKIGGPLDPKCPNVAQHPGDDKKHAWSCQNLIDSLTHCLAKPGGLKYLKSLHKHGRVGMIFKVRCPTSGFVVIGKDTIRFDRWTLQNEEEVYHRLEELQGIKVPVYLGIIELGNRGCPVQSEDFLLESFMLISYAGKPANPTKWSNWNHVLEKRSWEFFVLGVNHPDIHEHNCTEMNDRLVVVDFGSATLCPDWERIQAREKRIKILKEGELKSKLAESKEDAAQTPTAFQKPANADSGNNDKAKLNANATEGTADHQDTEPMAEATVQQQTTNAEGTIDGGDSDEKGDCDHMEVAT